ncbi:MAG: alkylation response protein AidB-like acyl-CoA dehydrogenase, partial [Cyclobacteriaceae bacterium]
MTEHYFTEEHRLFREGLQQFLQKEVVPFIDEWEANGKIDPSIWKKFGDMGYLGINYPEQYGGLGLDYFYMLIFLEELQKVNSGGFAAAIWAHTYLAMTHLKAEGSEAIKNKYLTASILGDQVG